MKIVFNKETEGCNQDTIRMISLKFPQIQRNIQLEIPEGFCEMEEETKKEYYPYENCPDIVLQDVQEGVQLTFRFLNKKMKVEEVRSAIEKVREITEKALPKYDQSPAYIYDSGQIPIGWFLIRMEDRAMEHIKAIFSIDEKMVLLTITFPKEKNRKWRVLIRYIFAAIRNNCDN